MDQKTVQARIESVVDDAKADIAKLKAKASEARAEVQNELDKDARKLDHSIERAGSKLSALAKTGEGTWVSVKKSAESTWASLKSAVRNTTSRPKK